jgi:hypothetical protein
MVHDVNGDGVVSPIDALLVINELGSKANPLRGVDRDYNHSLFADADGDGVISPIDALLVINALNDASSTQVVSAQAILYRVEHPASTDTAIGPNFLGATAEVLASGELPTEKRTVEAIVPDARYERGRLEGATAAREPLPPRVVDLLFGELGT